ncbi:MAG: mechanosensitive ion channel domain-containing protein [Gemmatimonadales bacterium]
MEQLSNAWDWITGVLGTSIFRLGQANVTVGTLLQVLILIPLVFWGTNWLRRVTIRLLATGGRLDRGASEAAGAIVRYVALALGLLLVLQASGIDLTTLNVLAGAVGIGVGFGLQSVVTNFVAGLIILFERPIKIGDRVVVGEIEGDVVAINARSTTVLTNDAVAIIVPNADFISTAVINWTHSGENVRMALPVTVAYGTDLDRAEAALLAAARSSAEVLTQPEPAVRVMGFGDNGINLELRVWTESMTHRKGILVSAVNRAIYATFQEEGITFPFPQRDVYLHGANVTPRPSTD